MLDRNQDDPAINDWLLALTEYCFDQSWRGSDAVRALSEAFMTSGCAKRSSSWSSGCASRSS